MIPNPHTQSAAESLASDLGTIPSVKATSKLLADIEAVPTPPVLTAVNKKTLGLSIRLNDEEGMHNYINLLLARAYVRGQRDELERSQEMTRRILGVGSAHVGPQVPEPLGFGPTGGIGPDGGVE